MAPRVTIGRVRAANLRAEIAVHGMRLPLGLLLVARAFELRAPENDIRAAAGLPGWHRHMEEDVPLIEQIAGRFELAE